MAIRSNILNLVKVTNGLDGNSLRIVTSSETILKFPNSVDDSQGYKIIYDIAPFELSIQLEEAGVLVSPTSYNNNINIYLNYQTDYQGQNIRISLKDVVETGQFNQFCYIPTDTQYFIFDINKLYIQILQNNTTYIKEEWIQNLNDFFDLVNPANIEIEIVYNGSVSHKYLLFQIGTSEDAARLSIKAGGIFASVMGTGLEFDSNGLTVTNGGFRIKKDNTDVLYFSEETGDLQIIGDVYANNGYFRGEIHATNGEFNGTITAYDGTIGGFDITSYEIKNGEDLILTAAHDGIESSIYVKNITLGSGAQIAEYLNIGNLSLLNPSGDDDIVLRLRVDNTDYFTLNNNGEIEGANWSIKEQNGYLTATFDRLVAENGSFSGTVYATDGHFEGEVVSSIISASTINTANFTTEKIRSMGGAFIFKPTFEIIDYEYIDNEDDLYRFKFTLDNSSANYFEALDLTKINIIGVSGFDVRYGKIESINQAQVNYEVYVQFYYGDYDVLINTDNKYNTLTLLGESGNTLNSIIGINSDSVNTILSPRALSMIKINSFNKGGNTNTGYLSYDSNLLLGDLSGAPLVGGRQLSGYGLYADNVFLRGSLTTNNLTNSSYAGVNTQQDIEFDYTTWNNETTVETDNEKIVFWGGAEGFSEENIRKAPFIVTDKGNIYARSGEFKGAVIADSVISHSVIQAAIIEGTGDSSPTLKIYDTGENGGIGFYNKTGNILTLTINNSGFYHADDTEPFISWNENNSNIIANLNQINIGNIILSNGSINYNNNTSITFDDVEIQLNYNNNGVLQVSNGLTTMYGNVSFNNNNTQKLDYQINNGYYCLFVR